MLNCYGLRFAFRCHTSYAQRTSTPEFVVSQSRSNICGIPSKHADTAVDRYLPISHLPELECNLFHTCSRYTRRNAPPQLGRCENVLAGFLSKAASRTTLVLERFSIREKHLISKLRSSGFASTQGKACNDPGPDSANLHTGPPSHPVTRSQPDSRFSEEQTSVCSQRLPFNASTQSGIREGDGLTLKSVKGASHRSFSEHSASKPAYSGPGRPGPGSGPGPGRSGASTSKMYILPLQRLIWAFPTWPSGHDWIFTASLAALAAIPIVPLSLWAEMFSLEHMALNLPVIMKTFFIPSLLEEVLWRVILNPHPREKASFETLLFWGILSTMLYILAHPTYAWYVRPVAWSLFSHPGFLLVCSVLGSCCCVVYQKTGSVWAPTVVHWLTCVIWLTLGGRQRAPLF